MTIEAIREYLKAIRLRYKNSTRGQRTRILDEFCEVCGYNRKHAIRILGRQDTDGKAAKPGPKPRYDSETITHLVNLWKLMNYMCSVRMKVALPLWLNYYTPEDMQAATRLNLLEISSSSIDRLPIPLREWPTQPAI